MGIASLTGRIGNMIAPFTATVVCIYAVKLLHMHRVHSRWSLWWLRDLHVVGQLNLIIRLLLRNK